MSTNYAIENGVIRTPGKFEGEPSYVPILWDLALEGAADDDLIDGETLVSLFNVDDELRRLCGAWRKPEAPTCDVVALWEDEQGFVHSCEMTRAEADAFAFACEQGDDDDDGAF